MEINNIEEIKKLLSFKEGTFYKFEALIRCKDGRNPITSHYKSNSKKNLSLRTWYIDNEPLFEEKILEMKEFCTLTGSRLYLNIDRKSLKKTISLFTKKFLCYILDGTLIYPKTIPNKFRSVASSVETSDLKRVLFDIDSKDSRVLDAVLNTLRFYSVPFITLDSINGYHVICTSREVLTSENLRTKMFVLSNLSYEEIDELISVKPNEMCLAYFNSKIY